MIENQREIMGKHIRTMLPNIAVLGHFLWTKYLKDMLENSLFRIILLQFGLTTFRFADVRTLIKSPVRWFRYV